MSNVDFSIKVYGNTLEIIPSEPIKNNSIYEITLSDVRAWSKPSKFLEKETWKVYTKLSPRYCALESVMSLIDSIEIDEDRVLYYIKEASLYSDYIANTSFDEDNVPFNIAQFVKFRSAHDALLKLYIERASEAGRKGQIGEINFETSDNTDAIKNLLNYLKGEADKWERKAMNEDYLKGAAPKAVVRSNPAHFSTKLSGFNRGPFG